MKLTLDARTDVNVIRSYAPGAVRIGEQTLHTHCIVAADRLIADWEVQSVDTLSAQDLEPVFALAPEVALLGTANAQRFPAREVRAAFAARGIGLEVMDLGAACRTYNILVQEARRVVAMLLVR